jgi:hypothetical protein
MRAAGSGPANGKAPGRRRFQDIRRHKALIREQIGKSEEMPRRPAKGVSGTGRLRVLKIPGILFIRFIQYTGVFHDCLRYIYGTETRDASI